LEAAFLSCIELGRRTLGRQLDLGSHRVKGGVVSEGDDMWDLYADNLGMEIRASSLAAYLVWHRSNTRSGKILDEVVTRIKPNEAVS